MTSTATRLTIRRPDDWHVHLRDGAVMAGVLPHTARQFARAIVMPNLSPPITTTEAGRAYRERILAALPDARLLLKARQYGEAAAAQAMRDRFAACGVF